MPWSIIDVFDDPDDKVDAFNNLFNDVLDMHAPLKTVRVKKNPTPIRQSDVKWTDVTGLSASTVATLLLLLETYSRPSETM